MAGVVLRRLDRVEHEDTVRDGTIVLFGSNPANASSVDVNAFGSSNGTIPGFELASR